MSSFRRRTTTAPTLPSGCRISSAQAQVLTSTGVASLDDLLGGGLPLGTTLLLHSDRGASSSYASLLLRYFCVQGVHSDQAVLLASADVAPRDFLASLPRLVDAQSTTTPAAAAKPNNAAGGDKLNIAWRYQNQAKVGDAVLAASRYCCNFDLSKDIDPGTLDGARLYTVHLGDSSATAQDQYDTLYMRILAAIDDGGFRASATPADPSKPRSVLRIAVHAMLSPFWCSRTAHSHLTFLHRLRALLRHSFAVAVVSVSSTSTVPAAPMHALTDFVLSLDAFATSATLPPAILNSAHLTAEYTGLLYIHKLARINSLVPASVKVNALGMGQNWAFKVRRKAFSVETWHLPPELEDEVVASSGVACASGTPGKKNHLDF
ncbi:Elongator subunit elp4 [Sorochytrium milnesiophthora]